MPKIQYPILSKRKIENLKRYFTSPNQIVVDSIIANKGRKALEIRLEHKKELDWEEVHDALMMYTGFSYKPCETVDKIYGDISYYFYEHRNRLWAAIREYKFDENKTNISLYWGRRFSKKMQERINDEEDVDKGAVEDMKSREEGREDID